MRLIKNWSSSEGNFKYLHQNKKACEEEQGGPLHPVQDDLKVLQVSQNQEPEGSQDSDPTWKTADISSRSQKHNSDGQKQNTLDLSDSNRWW